MLFPVCGRLSETAIIRNSFWLARNLPAELYLVEVIMHRGFVTRLFSGFIRKWNRQRLEAVQERAMWDESFYCEIGDVTASSWTMGIAEAARRLHPHYIILTPELQERLGGNGIRDLKQRVGSMGRCSLILLTRGLALGVEPCGLAVSEPSCLKHGE